MWRGHPRPRKTGVGRNGGLYCLSQLKVAESTLHAGGGARATPGYFVSILRFMFTVGRVSNWLTVFVSLLCPSNCA